MKLQEVRGCRDVIYLGTSQCICKANDSFVFRITGTAHRVNLDRRKRNGGDKVKKGKEIEAVVEEAAKIMKDYPNLKYKQAIALAKEALRHGEKYRKKP